MNCDLWFFARVDLSPEVLGELNQSPAIRIHLLTASSHPSQLRIAIRVPCIVYCVLYAAPAEIFLYNPQLLTALFMIDK